ncbi:hypothetical protein JCM18920_481 [Cutibacterium acnes JCM 18920]|nr:hypothetical protein JCM18920_481 [Cutibacterium acnes JCM 18920]
MGAPTAGVVVATGSAAGVVLSDDASDSVVSLPGIVVPSGTVDTMTAPAGTSVGFERISQTAMTDNATTSNTPTAEAWTRLTVRRGGGVSSWAGSSSAGVAERRGPGFGQAAAR